MPREAKGFEGNMLGNDLTPEGNFRRPIEVRLIREDYPGAVSIIVPDPDEYTRQMRREGRFNWIRTHQVDGVSVQGLIDALVGLRVVDRQPDGSYRISENQNFRKSPI